MGCTPTDFEIINNNMSTISAKNSTNTKTKNSYISSPSYMPDNTNPYANRYLCEGFVSESEQDYNDYMDALSKTHPETTFPEKHSFKTLKMDGFSNQKKLLINMDWLSFRLKETIHRDDFNDDNEWISENERYVLVLEEIGDTNYRYRACVWCDAVHIGWLYFDSRNKWLKETMQFKVENKILYDDRFRKDRKEDILSRLCRALNSEIYCCNRLDIAIDGVDFNTFFNNASQGLYSQLRGSKIKYQSELFDAPFYYTVGSRRGRKFARYYRKDLEIARHEGRKDYILEYWYFNGFNLDIPTYRFELQLNSQAIKRIKGFEIDDLFDNQKLQALFESQLKNFFQFVPAHHPDTKMDRRPKVALFEFPETVKQIYSRTKEVINSSLRTAKITIKDFCKRAVNEITEGRKIFAVAATQLLREYRLYRWLDRKSAYMFKDIKNQLNKSGCRIVKEMEYYENDLFAFIMDLAEHQQTPYEKSRERILSSISDTYVF